MDPQSDGTRTLQAVCCYDNAHAARLRLLACLFQAETTVRRRVILCPSAVGAQHQSGAVAWACHRHPRALHRLVGASVLLKGNTHEKDIAYRTCRTDTGRRRSEEHTSELQSLMRISYAVFC